VKALIISTLFLCLTAKADDVHYQNTMIGERASGMGGAFIAISDDPSGIYHNPAGILFNFDDNFSLSANVFSISETTYKDIIPGQDYKYSSSNLVGNLFGYTQNYGKHKIGFAIIIPNSDLYDQDDILSNVSTQVGKANELRRKFFRQNSTTLLGPAFATEISKDISFGATLFLGDHTDKAIDNQFISFNADSGGTERFFFQETTINRRTFFVQPKIGLQWMPQPKWSLGAVLSKNSTLYSNMRIKRLSSALNTTTGLPAPPTGLLANDISKSDTTLQPNELSPLEVGFGAAYFPTRTFMLSTDIKYYSADSSYTLSKTTDVINFSAGSEYFYSEELALRLGLFTNMANTPTLKNGSTDQNVNVNLYGLTTSVSILSANSSITVGAQLSTGTGKGQGIGGSTAIQTVTQSGHAAFVVLSSQM
jgi:hypothetical protein